MACMLPRATIHATASCNHCAALDRSVRLRVTRRRELHACRSRASPSRRDRAVERSVQSVHRRRAGRFGKKQLHRHSRRTCGFQGWRRLADRSSARRPRRCRTRGNRQPRQDRRSARHDRLSGSRRDPRPGRNRARQPARITGRARSPGPDAAAGRRHRAGKDRRRDATAGDTS